MGDSIGKLTVDVGARMAGLDAAFSKLERRLGKLQSRFSAIGQQLTTGVSLPLALVGGAAVKFAATFDEAMARSTAIMGESGQTMRSELEETARAVARSSTFSAREAAEAYYFLASAGLDASQSIAALPAVVDFATAGAFDLSTATDLLTDAQSALGLTVEDTSENLANMTHVSDALVAANTLANASVQQFSEALTNRAGAALRLVGKDIEEGVAVLAAWADQGTKGAEAGTRLDIVLRDLQKAAVAGKNTNREFYDAVYDLSGEMRNLGDIVSWLEDFLEGMSDAEKRAAISTLGLQEKSITATLSLVGLSEKIQGYEASLRAAGGTTQSVADKQLDNFADKMRLLWGRVQDVLISLGKALIPTLEELAGVVEIVLGSVAKGVEWFSKLDESVKGAVVTVALIVGAIGPLIGIIGKLIGVVWSLAAGIRALTVVMVANPFVLMATVLAGLVAVFVDWEDALGGVLKKNKELKSATEGYATVEEARRDAVAKSELELFKLQRRVDELREKLRGFPPGTLEWFKYTEQLREAEEQLRNLVQLTQQGGQDLSGIGSGYGEELGAFLGKVQQWTDAAEGGLLRVGEAVGGIAQKIAAAMMHFETAREVWQQYALQVRVTAANMSRSAVQLVDQAIGGIANAFGQSIGRAIVYQEKFGEVAKNLLSQLLSQTIATISAMIIQWGIYFLLGIAGFESLAQAAIMASAKRGGAGAAASAAEIYPWPFSLGAAIAAHKSMEGLILGLSAFAKGGVVFGPTLGLIGEAGPEAILPLDRLEGMLGARGTTINVLLDGEVLSRAVVRRMPDVLDLDLGLGAL